jgi:uncharacterized protein YkwD
VERITTEWRWTAMGRVAVAVVVALAAVALPVGTGGREAVAAVNCSTTTAGLDDQEAYFLVLVNQLRTAAGAIPLKVSPTLSAAAAWKAQDNQGRPLSETDSLGRGPAQLYADCDYPGASTAVVGQVFGRGTPSAQAMFEFLVASPSNLAHFLNPAYRVAGVARAGSGATTDWVIALGSVDDGVEPPPPGLVVQAHTPLLARD